MMAPGPAMSGKATGTMLAPPLLGSFLMMSRPSTISTARMNSTKAPATAKEAELIPKSRKSASPAKKKSRNSPNAVRHACAALMSWFFSRMLIKIGIEPRISMMANITIKELKISTKLI